jgi:S1-C subfamily serine protease
MTEENIKTESRSHRDVRSILFHVVIFAGATAVLVVGGMWRGDGQQESEPQSEGALIAELRKEVAGLQLGLNDSELSDIRDTVTKAAASVARSVVSVQPIDGTQPLRSIPVFSDLENRNSGRPSSAALSPGISGIVIDPAGYVLTSANVARLGTRIQLMFADGQQSEAEVVGLDAEDFLGLLKMKTPPANMVTPDFSKVLSDFQAGDWLIRQGRSPSGRESLSLCLLESVRPGTKDRPIGFLDSTAAAEMDGGVLTDINGRLVGIYTSPPQAPAFVVPINRALSVASRLKSVPHRVPQSRVGLEFQDLTDELREYFSVAGGVLVTNVLPNSPAASAGLRAGDIVQKLDAMDMASAAELTMAITDKPAGTSVRLGIRRGLRDRVVTLVTAPYFDTAAITSPDEQTLTLKMRDSLTPDGPAIVDVTPTGLANRIGLLSGDLIIAVNSRPVRRVAELIRVVQTLPAGKSRLLQIKRGDQMFFIAVKETINIDE